MYFLTVLVPAQVRLGSGHEGNGRIIDGDTRAAAIRWPASSPFHDPKFLVKEGGRAPCAKEGMNCPPPLLSGQYARPEIASNCAHIAAAPIICRPSAQEGAHASMAPYHARGQIFRWQ